MPFHKIETTSNFVFGSADGANLQIADHGSDVFRVQVPGQRWPRGGESYAPLDPSGFAGTPSSGSVKAGNAGELSVSLGDQTLLASTGGRGFGVCGTKWLFTFPWNPDHRFYGMGEKNLGFELSQKRTQFWNTDVFADFAMDLIQNGSTDPMYATFPVLIVKTPGGWLAIVVNNPYPVFMNTGAGEAIFQPGAGPFIPEVYLGSRDGEPDVFILVSDRPDVLVQRIQRLQGTTPLPPLWALGHHQSRWGYQSPADLNRIADEFTSRGIPDDGLWFDIQYMDGYRVFTTDPQHFPDPVSQLKAITDRGYRVVPILDPGLRKDESFGPYLEAQKRGILCQTEEGREFVGYVWPGYTVFPDFSLVEGREFWAQQVEAFTRLGFSGYWIDMNDPATGSVPHGDMRFGHGRLPHDAWHNQYALGMAEATRDGLKRAHPTERPFVLSRSAFLGQARYSAMWLGDNVSNEHHMKGSIALSLNLAVSGMPFNGPDVPGFVGDASAELMRAWYKLGFLFPFLRNHTIIDSQPQELWTRDDVTTAIVTDFIRLRYRLIPYLYQLFVEQAARGSPMLRPVWYHDASADFETTDDVFFVGPAILQAPFVELAATERTVRLPKHPSGNRWFDPETRQFIDSGALLVKKNHPAATPLFLASPSLIPLQPGLRTTNAKDLSTIEILVVLEPGQSVSANYQADDGISTQVDRGARSVFQVEASMNGSQEVAVEVTALEKGFGDLVFAVLVVCPGQLKRLTVQGNVITTRPTELAFAGSPILGWSTSEFRV